MKHSCVIVLGLLAIGLIGCAATGPANLPPQSDTDGTSVLVDLYLMDVGDVIEVSVRNNPDLSVSAPIRPDGMISFPMVGDIMAAGLGPEQLSTNIEKQLSSYIKNPHVTVILTSMQGHEFISKVRVTGAVGASTALTYHQGMTVIDAVLGAGSLDIYADGNRTKLHRRTESGMVSYDIRLKDILEKGDMTTNVYLLPGDIITVPERAF